MIPGGRSDHGPRPAFWAGSPGVMSVTRAFPSQGQLRNKRLGGRGNPQVMVINLTAQSLALLAVGASGLDAAISPRETYRTVRIPVRDQFCPVRCDFRQSAGLNIRRPRTLRHWDKHVPAPPAPRGQRDGARPDRHLSRPFCCPRPCHFLFLLHRRTGFARGLRDLNGQDSRLMARASRRRSRIFLSRD